MNVTIRTEPIKPKGSKAIKPKCPKKNEAGHFLSSFRNGQVFAQMLGEIQTSRT